MIGTSISSINRSSESELDSVTSDASLRSERPNSLRSQFWRMHALMDSDELMNVDTESNATRLAYYQAIDRDRPTNNELLGFMTKYIPNSSTHYGGSLPLTSKSQNTHVLVRSSHCWKTVGPIIPAANPSFRKIDMILKANYGGSSSSPSSGTSDSVLS